jgi:DNA-binding HxlR family transcriptional regulator
MAGRTVKSPEVSSTKEALVREMLERVADKWTLLVIDALEGKTEVRFSRLRERIGDVSQKMLTKTLRQLERDGLVTRRVHAEVPPRVDYRLTPLGESLGEAVCSMWTWVETHLQAVERSRRSYDTAASRRSNRAPTRMPGAPRDRDAR